MVFTNNDLHVIRHHLETRFRPLNMVIRFRFPVMNGIRCATKPSGTILIVSTLPIGRVWLVSADEGFSLDDVILPKWQNCLHGEDGHIEPRLLLDMSIPACLLGWAIEVHVSSND